MSVRVWVRDRETIVITLNNCECMYHHTDTRGREAHAVMLYHVAFTMLAHILQLLKKVWLIYVYVS